MPESAARLGRRPAGDALGPSHLATTSLVDTRTGKNTTHCLDGQFRQSIHGRLAPSVRVVVIRRTRTIIFQLAGVAITGPMVRAVRTATKRLRAPPSRCAGRTQRRILSGEQPNLPAITVSAAASPRYSPRCSITSSTERSRNSGEYGFEVLFRFCSITGNCPRVLPSGKPGAVHT